jgi:hypothetical protein
MEVCRLAAATTSGHCRWTAGQNHALLVLTLWSCRNNATVTNRYTRGRSDLPTRLFKSFGVIAHKPCSLVFGHLTNIRRGPASASASAAVRRNPVSKGKRGSPRPPPPSRTRPARVLRAAVGAPPTSFPTDVTDVSLAENGVVANAHRRAPRSAWGEQCRPGRAAPTVCGSGSKTVTTLQPLRLAISCPASGPTLAGTRRPVSPRANPWQYPPGD